MMKKGKGYPTHLSGKSKQTFGDPAKISEDKWGKLSNRGVLNEWKPSTSYEWPSPKKGSRKSTM